VALRDRLADLATFADQAASRPEKVQPASALHWLADELRALAEETYGC
jgi:hypothetical protein